MPTALLALTLLALSPQELDRAALAEVVEPHLAEQGIPGAVVALVVDGKPTCVEAFGLSDLAKGRPMTADTRFQVGSVTKPVTATLVALLAEDGALSLDDPLAKHVAVPPALEAITLLQLATHTSGLPREPVNRRNLPDSPSVMIPMSIEELQEGLIRTELVNTPGETWEYSNLGYALLGVVAASAADEPYDQLVAERVLAPLGMTASAVHVGADPVAGLATCYWPEDDEPLAREPWHFGTACAFSGLVSTGGDLARFLAAQLAEGPDAPLPVGVRELLHTPQVTIDEQRGRAMAPGWFVDPLPGGMRALGHGGEVDGHSAVIAFFPELRAGIVVLCNRGGDSAEGLVRPLMQVALKSWMTR